MTLREFRTALKVLGKRSDPIAEREFRRLPPEMWSAAVLEFYPELQRRCRRRLRWIAACYLAMLPVAVVALILHWRFAVMVGPVFQALALCLRFTTVDEIAPLLVRLDDPRLVPLWLEALPQATHTLDKVAIRRHLTRHLPDWHQSGEPLPEPARKRLASTVRSLSDRRLRSAEEEAFLVAALISLDAALDTKTQRAVEQIARVRTADERVALAAEDALVRLRPPAS